MALAVHEAWNSFIGVSSTIYRDGQHPKHSRRVRGNTGWNLLAGPIEIARVRLTLGNLDFGHSASQAEHHHAERILLSYY